MRIFYKSALILGITLVSCKNGGNSEDIAAMDASEVHVIRMNEGEARYNTDFIENVTKEAQKHISNKNFTPFDDLQMQKLDRIEENSEVVVKTADGSFKNGNEIYYHLRERTMMMGSAYFCTKCPNVHLNNASGFVIHEDGVVVTNYHVIEVKDHMEITGIFAGDYEGNSYPVTEILSASQSNDIAILKVDTGGKKLKALSLAETELIGEDVFMMGHPFSNTFFMDKGIIARPYISHFTGEPKIAITAEYGQGASGGPVVNTKGELVGIVSATYSHYTNNSKQNGDLQLITREVVPVSVLHEYVKKN